MCFDVKQALVADAVLHTFCPQIIMCGVNYVKQAQVAGVVPHIINLGNAA